jgi:hypothetical protein
MRCESSFFMAYHASDTPVTGCDSALIFAGRAASSYLPRILLTGFWPGTHRDERLETPSDRVVERRHSESSTMPAVVATHVVTSTGIRLA